MDSLPFDLNNLHFFVLVVERRGFTAAADALGVPKSRVSRHVAWRRSQSLSIRAIVVADGCVRVGCEALTAA
jgi:Bacterial regulatory helix-turn-helix protein, lysR family